MKKGKQLVCVTLVFALIVGLQSFLVGNEAKASSKKPEKSEPQFVMVEITEEEYLARLNDVNSQADNKNATAYAANSMTRDETIALPTTIPNQNELRVCYDSPENENSSQFVMTEITEEEYLARLNDVDSQAENLNVNTYAASSMTKNETIALPTPIPSQNIKERNNQLQTTAAASYTSTDIPYYFDLYTMGGD